MKALQGDKLDKAQEHIRDNKTMAKMRAIAYAPVHLKEETKNNLEAAEAKRLRKQMRNISNIQNEQKHLL